MDAAGRGQPVRPSELLASLDAAVRQSEMAQPQVGRPEERKGKTMTERELLRQRACIARLEAETLRVRIRIEGMKAVNRQRKLEGQKTLRHLDDDYRALEASIASAMANFEATLSVAPEAALPKVA